MLGICMFDGCILVFVSFLWKFPSPGGSGQAPSLALARKLIDFGFSKFFCMKILGVDFGVDILNDLNANEQHNSTKKTLLEDESPVFAVSMEVV